MISTQDAAAMLGCTPQTVRLHARTLGLGVVIGRIRVLSKADVEKIGRAKHSQPGNPNFGRPKPARAARKRAKKSPRKRKAG